MTTLQTINAEWKQLATAAVISIEDRGDCRHAVTFYRHDRHLAMTLMRWVELDDHDDDIARWAELGALAAGLKADTAVFMMDAWLNFATEEELDAPGFVRPREDPTSIEALHGFAITLAGAVTTSLWIPYHRGDRGEITLETPRLDESHTESDLALAFLTAFREGRGAADPVVPIRAAARQGHIIFYKGKPYVPSE